jgi:hypothetical protein
MTDIEMLQRKGTIKTFQFSYENLRIQSDAIYEFIGFEPGEAPEPFPEIIGEIMSTAGKFVSAQGGYIISENVEVNREKKQTLIGDILFTTENIVTRHMANVQKMAVFACTAGPEITTWAADLNRQGNIIHAYIADALGSVIVGRTMDIIAESLGIYMHRQQLKTTNRYSPGYCGWPLAELGKVMSLLPGDFCGITHPGASTLKPVKSVCGFIGIGTHVLFDQHTCHYCRDVNCTFCGKK